MASSTDRKHELAYVLARFHHPVRVRGAFEWKRRVHDRTHDRARPEPPPRLTGRGPEPACAAVNENRFRRLESAALEDVRPHGEERFWNGGRVRRIDAVRHGQTLRCGGDAVLRVASAGDERTDRIAGSETVDTGAERLDRSSDLEPGNI